MFYHARVVCKRERAKELAPIGFEYDLTREDLLAKIAIPFFQKQQFFCGGLIIQAERVEQVKFSRTSQNVESLVRMIEARRKMHQVVVFSPAAREVISEGVDSPLLISLITSKAHTSSMPSQNVLIKSNELAQSRQ